MSTPDISFHFGLCIFYQHQQNLISFPNLFVLDVWLPGAHQDLRAAGGVQL